jgi:hypothetical protein
MPEFYDTTSIHDEPEYWDGVAARVSARALRAAGESVVDWLASARTAWTAMLIVAAALAAIVIWPVRSMPERSRVEWTPAFAPSDYTGRLMTAGDYPPDLVVLMDQRGSLQ